MTEYELAELRKWALELVLNHGDENTTLRGITHAAETFVAFVMGTPPPVVTDEMKAAARWDEFYSRTFKS